MVTCYCFYVIHCNVVGTQLLAIQEVHETRMHKYHFMISCEDTDGMNALSLKWYSVLQCCIVLDYCQHFSTAGWVHVCTVHVHVCDVCLDIVACDVHGGTWDPILGSSKLQH